MVPRRVAGGDPQKRDFDTAIVAATRSWLRQDGSADVAEAVSCHGQSRADVAFGLAGSYLPPAMLDELMRLSLVMMLGLGRRALGFVLGKEIGAESHAFSWFAGSTVAFCQLARMTIDLEYQLFAASRAKLS